jgi:uroporphyrinogen III methyltransferase / synthase
MSDPAAPLRGRRILVTRRPEQSSSLVARLREAGATVVEVPLLEIAPPEDAAPLDEALYAVDRYDWIAFTSANAVRAVADRLRALAPAPHWPRIASVGPATTEAIHEHLPGARVDVEPPSDFRAEGLLAALENGEVRARRFLLPVSHKAREILADGLAARGARVDRVVAYRTLTPANAATALGEALAAGVDVVTFASPSAVESFVELAPKGAAVRAAVIGPVTEARARAAGLEVVLTAAPSTAAGLVDALVRAFGR